MRLSGFARHTAVCSDKKLVIVEAATMCCGPVAESDKLVCMMKTISERICYC